MSINRWMNKEVVVQIPNGILLSHKKEHIWVSSDEVDEPRTYYREVSQKEKVKIIKKKKQTRNKTTIWPSNPTTVHTPWENHNSKRYMDPSVYCSTVCSSQDMEATLMSINRWMNKEVVVHTYFEILLSHKKEWIWVSPSEVNEPRACYTE